MNPADVKGILEAILFVAEEPVTVEQILAVLEDRDAAEIESLLGELSADCQREGRGLMLQRVAGGWRFVTRPAAYPAVSEFLNRRRAERLSRAALETLAVIAYRQPVTAPEIAALRGVDPGASVKTLLDRGLVRILGRKKVVGKPFLYGTTQEFLVHFGLNSLDELPSLEEFESVLAERYRMSAAEGDAGAPAGDGDSGEGVGGGDEFWDEAARETARAAENRRSSARRAVSRAGAEEE